jgi:23S rRNA (uracil1939-C5)-methyltransferase
MIVEIEKLVHNGYGIGRFQNRVYFVPFTLPNEKVKIKDIINRKDYSMAKLETVLEPSPHRIEPICPYFGRCGGCHFQHIDYTEQLNQKSNILKETLKKIGNIEIENLNGIIYDEPFYYRNRVKFKVSDKEIGFVGVDEDFVKIEHCPISSKAINDLIPFLKEFAKHFNPSWISVFYSDTQKEYIIKFASYDYIDKEKLKKFKEHLTPKNVVGITLIKDDNKEDKIIFSIGTPFTFIELLEIKYRISINSFFQVNIKVAQKLLQTLLEKENYFDRVLDDYGGVGLFGLHLARRVGSVDIADINKSSINDAEYSAKINNINNASFYIQNSYIFLKKSLSKHANLLVLDPPRSGLSKEEIDLILLGKPDYIWYISCEPSSLARDLKLLGKRYKIKEIYMADMFPQTYHIETAVKLELV